MSGIIPPKHRDREDKLDWHDGWHEASGLGFKSQRDPDRLSHPAAALMAAGRSARERHREATGL